MNSIFISAIAAGAIAVTVQPSLAQPTAHAPVRIASCTVVPVHKPAFFGDNDVAPSSPRARVWISFRDRSAHPATAVTFLVKGRNSAETITTHGRFSKGVLIRKTLGPVSGVRGDDSCSVYSARFANGVAWSRMAWRRQEQEG
jgi:hypothetical protein